MATKIHRIGVISDTHGLIRDEVREILGTCEVILHGGDIDSHKILNEIQDIAPLYVVKGNNDKEWADYMRLPESLSLELFGLKIYMVHDRRHLPKDLADRNLIIYGHSHRYSVKEEDGRIWLNPGSCGPRRFGQPVMMVVIEAAEGDAGNHSISINCFAACEIGRFSLYATTICLEGRDSSRFTINRSFSVSGMQ